MASNYDGDETPSLHPIRHHHHHHCGGYHHQQHRHFFYVSPRCPLHRPILLPNNHSLSCSFSTSPQTHNPAAPVSPNPQLIVLRTHPDQICDDADLVEDEMGDDDGGEDPIFVLTDEWRDFFAESEAKRRLAKKQAKKGKKK